MEFKKAVKTKSRLRLAIDGVSGSGKTYTALAIASGMGGPIALIDSEHGSASLYADKFDFDTLDLVEFQIENYIEALKAAATAKYPVVIIDSTSHAWDALVERVDRIANTLTGGNASFRAWAQGTPLQKQLIEALLSYPGHVIVTCRSKTEYSIDKDEKNKTTISKVGLAAVQRAGFEYEFTMTMSMDANHVGHVTKDRTSKFQDKFITKPDQDFGKKLIAWLNEGAEVPPPPQTKNAEQQNDPADKRKTLLNMIGEILKTKNPDALPYFTEEEIANERNLARGKDIENLANQHTRLEKELEKRIAEYVPIPFEDAPPEKRIEPGYMTPPKKETPAASTATQPHADDGFEDDVPWGDDDKPGKGKKGGKPKSQSAETETADADASEELALS